MLYLSYEDYHNTFGGLLTAQQYAVFGARAAHGFPAGRQRGGGGVHLRRLQ